MVLKRLKKLIGYITHGEYGRTRDALILFALSLVPGGNRYAGRFLGDQKDLTKTLLRYYGYSENNQSQSTINVDIIVQDGDKFPKSSAFIRLIAPLTHPIIQEKVSLKMHNGIHPTIRNNAHICIVQRTAIKHEQTAINLLDKLKQTKTALIIDTDDAFFAVDNNHPEFKIHSSSDKAFGLLLGAADQLWVSTNELQKYYEKIVSSPVYVFKNSIDDRIWRQYIPDNVQRRLPLQVIYMGTATHTKDFEMLVEWLDEVHEHYPLSFELTLVGVTTKLPYKEWIRTVPRDRSTVMYPNFVRWIQAQGPFDVGVSPLVENKFNQFKSDIKALDYLGTSTLPVVSDLKPYSAADLAPYIVKLPNEKTAWVAYLENIIADLPTFRKKKIETLHKAQDYLWQQRSTEKVAKKIYGTLSKINEK